MDESTRAWILNYNHFEKYMNEPDYEMHCYGVGIQNPDYFYNIDIANKKVIEIVNRIRKYYGRKEINVIKLRNICQNPHKGKNNG